ncbi:hypothetical protein [Fictibacillus enclensis]|uniref:hypothetical protein n=1 Tax=Fictibacillus enclensis TaxID=1017270 RepID=UPI0024BF6BFD|nr:hypothetical protein [Fictibacillus enclensis]WHY72640.1 hypothetical protein QNH15_01485 [Fictibacillus enclensis]
MRKRIRLKSNDEANDATKVWMQHLIQRLIMEQMDMPLQLQAKIIHGTTKLKNKEIRRK